LFLPKTNRKIIPRWRDFWTTAALGLLTPAVTYTEESQLPRASEIEAHEAWRLNHTLWHALDLVGSALVVGDISDPDVLSAAKFLESKGRDCPAPARQLVKRIVHPEEQPSLNVELSAISQSSLRVEIQAKRLRLGDEPRNAILWTDLARVYASLGNRTKAEHAIQMSRRLAPDNRFVICSAARFLVHIGDYEQALRLLRTTILSQSDPWIVAAEIGVSTFSAADPRFLKLGRRMVDSRDFSDFAKSELASALATIELNEGNRRAAKKFFKQSLTLPTENSVAQAEWASAQVGDLYPPATQPQVPRNYEARSLYGYRVGDWETARTNAEDWLNDQPFSSRPANVLSYLYSTILERHEEALEVLNFSLRSNPDDRSLINNKAFNLINLERLDEAETLLKRTDPKAIDDPAAITLIATKGLLLFRRGLPEIGRLLYLDAIDIAKRKDNGHYSAMAALRLALEELRADTQTKSKSVRNAVQLAASRDEPDVRHVYARLATLAKLAKLEID
jgi:tetratricopeptide (TPR) repeat protein